MSPRAARLAAAATPAVAMVVCAPEHLTRFSPPKLTVALLGVLLGLLALGSAGSGAVRTAMGASRSARLAGRAWWGLMAWAALSLAWSPDPGRGAVLGLGWLLAGLWVLLLVRTQAAIGSHEGLRRQTAWTWLTAAVVVAGLALVQRGGLLPLGLHQVTSTLGNPNRVAMVLVLSLPLALVLARGEQSATRRWLARCLALVLLVAIVATGCRAAMAAVAVQVLFWCLTTRRSLRFRAASVALILIAGGLAYGPGVQLVSANRAAAGRGYIARVSARVVAERPVRGAGLGGFPLRASQAQGKVLVERPGLRGHWSHLGDAHNQWLMVGGQLGLVGVVLLLLLLLPALWHLVGRGFAGPRSGRSPWARHALAAWIGLGVCAMTETVLLSPVVVLLAFGWLALGHGPPVVAQPDSRPWSVRLAIPVVLAVCGVALATSHLLAQFHLGQGLRQLGQAPVGRTELKDAERRFDRGLAHLGASSELHLQRGLVRRELGDLTGAIEDLRRAYALRPGPDRALTLGDLWLSRGENRTARRWYRRALWLHPRYQRAYNNLGVALVRAGQSTQACRYLVRARSLRPADRVARQNVRAYCGPVPRAAQAAR